MPWLPTQKFIKLFDLHSGKHALSVYLDKCYWILWPHISYLIHINSEQKMNFYHSKQKFVKWSLLFSLWLQLHLPLSLQKDQQSQNFVRFPFHSVHLDFLMNTFFLAKVLMPETKWEAHQCGTDVDCKGLGTDPFCCENMCCYDEFMYCCDFGLHNSCTYSLDNCPIGIGRKVNS